MDAHEFFVFLAKQAWPVGRMLLSISAGLLVANFIEVLNWTRAVSRLAAPLVRLGHMQDVTGASFSVAFFSGFTANTLLADAYNDGRLGYRELVLANLFNSLPTFFLHLPTMFFVTVPFLGGEAAGWYVGLALFAALLRTVFVIGLGRLVLPPLPEGCVSCHLPEAGITWKEALLKTWRRFKRRIVKVALVSLPIFYGMQWLAASGFFAGVEAFMKAHLDILPWISPAAVSIVVFGMAAEFTAGLAAAGAVLHQGTLPVSEVVLALMLGNILSSPMRAFRHQFPYYAGIFSPALAARLILYNQILRAASLVVVAMLFSHFAGR